MVSEENCITLLRSSSLAAGRL